ncbi:MAG: sacsin N-terminal ATP-binding-like domain-containing protein [Microcoleus sp.]
MSFIDEVRSEREDLARVLKKHLGIRRIVEDLYPENAHFIYELLQNAEDTGATQAQFTLSANCLVFEHNGRPFSNEDIYGITDIGEGTKAGDEDKIGRFGVGFKAVFAYSETPYIWSPAFAFKITDLVLPTEITPRSWQSHPLRVSVQQSQEVAGRCLWRNKVGFKLSS